MFPSFFCRFGTKRGDFIFTREIGILPRWDKEVKVKIHWRNCGEEEINKLKEEANRPNSTGAREVFSKKSKFVITHHALLDHHES